MSAEEIEDFGSYLIIKQGEERNWGVLMGK